MLLLHHTNKSESNNSFIKTRGSSDLTASPDCGFEVISMDVLNGQKQLRFKHFKTRRGAIHAPFGVVLKDVHDGVRLEVGDLFECLTTPRLPSSLRVRTSAVRTGSCPTSPV